MKVQVDKILRKGKKHTRVLLSTGEEKLYDSSEPVSVGQVLNFESQEFGCEIRPLLKSDPFPSLLILD